MKTIFQKCSLIISLCIIISLILPQDVPIILIIVSGITLGIYIDPFTPIKK